jgi:hypothetical protein
MENEFIPFQQALELKELGFDEECLFAYYGKSDLSNFKEYDYDLCGDRNNLSLKDGEVSAPLYQQAFRWFREKYGIHITPKKFDATTWIIEWGSEWGSWESPVYYSYEEAELACLNKLIVSFAGFR